MELNSQPAAVDGRWLPMKNYAHLCF